MEDCPSVEHAEAPPAALISIPFVSNFLVEPQVPHMQYCQQHQSISDLLKVRNILMSIKPAASGVKEMIQEHHLVLT